MVVPRIHMQENHHKQVMCIKPATMVGIRSNCVIVFYLCRSKQVHESNLNNVKWAMDTIFSNEEHGCQKNNSWLWSMCLWVSVRSHHHRVQTEDHVSKYILDGGYLDVGQVHLHPHPHGPWCMCKLAHLHVTCRKFAQVL